MLIIVDFLRLWFYRSTSDHHTDLLKITGWILGCIGFFGCMLCENTILSYFGIDKLIRRVDSLDVVFVGFVVVVACLVWQYVRLVVGVVGSFLGMWMLSLCPNYIIDLLKGSLIDECLFFAWWQNIILLVHVILLGLLLFSLQKTARKNSIVPN